MASFPDWYAIDLPEGNRRFDPIDPHSALHNERQEYCAMHKGRIKEKFARFLQQLLNLLETPAT